MQGTELTGPYCSDMEEENAGTACRKKKRTRE
jgi:hypothetical protein